MSNFDIQLRIENTPVPDGFTMFYSGAGRLHITYQETNGTKVKRIRIAVPTFSPESSIIEIMDNSGVDVFEYDREEEKIAAEKFKKGE